MAKADRDLRKFEPGSTQEERFNLVKQAMISHRERSKSDVATIQLASPHPIVTAKASLETRLKNYIDRENTRLEGLPQKEKVKLLFPKPPTEFWSQVRASGLSPKDWIKRNQAATATISEPLEYMLKRGGTTPAEIGAQRINPKRMGEILETYFARENIQVISGENKLYQMLRQAGSTEEQAEAYIAGGRYREIAGRSHTDMAVLGGKKVFIADADQLDRISRKFRGIPLEDPNRVRMVIGGHEAIESVLQKKIADTTQKVAAHHAPSIYAADLGFAAKLDSTAVQYRINKHSREMPSVIEGIKRWADPDKRRLALEEIKSLPDKYAATLRAHGYSAQEIDTHVQTMRRAINPGFSPTPNLAKATSEPLAKPPATAKPPKQTGKPGNIAPPLVFNRSGELVEVNELKFTQTEIKIAPPPSPTKSDIQTKWSRGTGTAGRSNWSRWLSEELIPKGSARFLVRGPTSEYKKKLLDRVGKQELKKHLPKTEWLAFNLDLGGERFEIDLTQPSGRRALQRLELWTAEQVGDTAAAEKIRTRITDREEKRRAEALLRIEDAAKKRVTTDPVERSAETAARKTVDRAIARRTQGTAEFQLPAVLDDYVSRGIRDVQKASELPTLTRVAPYAAGILIGADVLASRDKTGPFWGGVAAGAAWLLTRGRAPKMTSLLASGASYGVGRAIGGAIAASHNGSLEGFHERGFAPAMRQTHSDFGSGWQGIVSGAKAFLKTDAGKAIGGAIGLGVAIGVATGDFGSGYNAATSAIGGAAIGYLKGGRTGALIGAVGGAVGGTALNKTVEKFGGGVGEAFLGGVTTSVAASLTMAGMLRGGLFYRGVRASTKAAGLTDEMFVKAFKAMGAKDPLGPTGLARNPSDVLQGYSAHAAEFGLGETAQKVLSHVTGYLDKSPTVKKYFDAAFGSPKLIEAAQKAGGGENITTAGFAKAIGQDILEGLPVGLAFSAISLPFSTFGGKGSSREASHNASIGGFGETGEAAIGRKQLTDFGSGLTGLAKAASAAVTFVGRKVAKIPKTMVGRLPWVGPAEEVASRVVRPTLPIGYNVRKTLAVSSASPSKITPDEGLVTRYHEYVLSLKNQKEAGVITPLAPVPKPLHSPRVFEKGPSARELYAAGVKDAQGNIRGEWSASDVNKALMDYAKEKGLDASNVSWGVQQRPILKADVHKPAPSRSFVRDKDISVGDIGSDPTIQTAADKPALLSKKKKGLRPSSVVKARHKNVRLDDISWDEFGTPETSGISGDISRSDTIFTSGGSRPRSVNEMVQTVTAPVPAFHKPVDPLTGTIVQGATSKTHIGSAPALSDSKVESVVDKFAQTYSDMAYSSPHGSRMRAHKPRVLESFTKAGVTGALRKSGTGGDFGTGWDPLRRIAASFLGKVSKEGAEQALRGAKYKEFLRSDDFQRALKAGVPVKGGELGKGGFSSVQLMETDLPDGTKFRFARKTYTVPEELRGTPEFAEEFMRKTAEGEAAGLRAMQETIAPSVYGTGKLAKADVAKLGSGATEHVLYMEAIEGAQDASKVIAQQGGFTKSQAKQLTRAVRDLHKEGLYHSDVRPSNMLFDKDNRLVLIDPMPSRYESAFGKTANKIGQAQDLEALHLMTNTVPPGFGQSLKAAGGHLSNAVFNTITSITKHQGEIGHLDRTGKAVLKMTQDIFRRAGAEDMADIFGIPMPKMSPAGVSSGVGSAKAVSSARSGRPASSSPIAAHSEEMKTGVARPSKMRNSTPKPSSNGASLGYSKTGAAKPAAIMQAKNSLGVVPTLANEFGSGPTVSNQIGVAPTMAANQFGESAADVAATIAAREQLHQRAVKTAAAMQTVGSRGHTTMAQAPTVVGID